MEYKELDFQEHGIPANNDRVLIVEVNDEGKAVGAKNYNLSELKDFIDADALAYLEECRLIDTSVRNIAIQSEKLLDDTRGETIESLEQTVTSTEPGGVNVFTITQKNGSQKSLQTRNGLRGPEGPQGPAVPLVQTTGQSTTEAMSQKAVSDEFNQLKSDLDSKINYSDSLSYEEITATNIDFTNKVASAESVYKMNETETINFSLINCTGFIDIKRKGKLMSLSLDVNLTTNLSKTWVNLGTINRDIGIYYGGNYPLVLNTTTGECGILQIYASNGVTIVRVEINGNINDRLRTSAMLIAN